MKNDEDEGLAQKQTRARSLIAVSLAFCCVLVLLQLGSVSENNPHSANAVQIRTKVIERNHSNEAAGINASEVAPATEIHESFADKEILEHDNNPGVGATSDATCIEFCTARTEARDEKFGGNLLDRMELVRMARQAKDKLIETLRTDYGDYFDPIFVGPGKTFTPITEGGPSMERLKRKLMIKVLEVQTSILNQDRNVADTCDCTDGAGKPLSSMVKPEDVVSLQVDSSFAQFVWATGGHSAAAGHGNLFNESYTAHLGRDARTVFGAIGIEFEDRNYAMGGTTSASEISMCWQQIFGDDVDFFSWDFGMTDGNYEQRMMHYAYRGGLSPKVPAMLAMRVGGRVKGRRETALRTLEAHGMAVFLGSDESFQLRNAAVPDSAGISKEAIGA